MLTFVVGASIIINQYLGAEDHWNANHVLAQAMMVGTIMAFVISCYGILAEHRFSRHPRRGAIRPVLRRAISQNNFLFRSAGNSQLYGIGHLRMVGDTVVTMKINLFTNILHLTLASFSFWAVRNAANGKLRAQRWRWASLIQSRFYYALHAAQPKVSLFYRLRNTPHQF